MKKIGKYFLVVLFFSLITFLYSYYLFPIDNDEIWNYGFAHNIYSGLIPYKDFNMIIPPLFAFSILPFFYLFGDSLLVFHLYSSLITGLLILFMYFKIEKKAFLIYPILMFGYLPSYNLFCVFLFTILMFMDDSKIKQKDLVMGFIVSLMFLTKQTIGVCMIIPVLFYSKKRLKTFTGFLIPILVFIIYLLCSNSFYEFIDYCFLGMFSFTSSNGSINGHIIIILLLCIFCIFKLIIGKFKNRYYFYALMFQVIILPTGSYYHFYVSLSVLVYAILIDNNISLKMFIYLLLYLYGTLIAINFANGIRNGIEFNPIKEGRYYGRNANEITYYYLDEYKKCLDYSNGLGYDHLFVFSKSAYFLKIKNEQVINKFDLINNGNMGYKAHNGYISDIESMCADDNCIFIVEKYDDVTIGQTNSDLLNYPEEHYNLKKVCSVFWVYKNDV